MPARLALRSPGVLQRHRRGPGVHRRHGLFGVTMTFTAAQTLNRLRSSIETEPIQPSSDAVGKLADTLHTHASPVMPPRGIIVADSNSVTDQRSRGRFGRS